MLKRLIVTVLFALWLSTCSLAETTVGTFQKVEFGDYAHLIIIDEKGETRSFWLGNDPALKTLITNSEEYQNRKIRVEWHLVKRNIPEAGGPMKIEEVISVKRL